MATVKWTARGAADTLVAGTSLNALADAAYALGAEIDNGTDLKLYMDIDLVLSAAVTAGAGAPFVAFHLMPSLDGTNYPTPGNTAAVPPSGYLAGTIAANASASFTRGSLRGVVIPPGKFKLIVQNKLGVAFPTSDTSAISGYRYGEQVA